MHQLKVGACQDSLSALAICGSGNVICNNTDLEPPSRAVFVVGRLAELLQDFVKQAILVLLLQIGSKAFGQVIKLRRGNRHFCVSTQVSCILPRGEKSDCSKRGRWDYVLQKDVSAVQTC